MQIVYAFDVDETLEVSNGPVKVKDLRDLRNQGHIVGICGNWAHFVNCVPDWYTFISFVGQMWMSKTDFLTQIKTYVKADGYVMIGNDPAHYGSSNDIQAAKEANWIFVREDKWDINTNYVEKDSYNIEVRVNFSQFNSSIDYDFCYLGIHANHEATDEIARGDLTQNDILEVFQNNGDKLIKTFNFTSAKEPKSYLIWPHSKTKGWLTRTVYIIN